MISRTSRPPFSAVVDLFEGALVPPRDTLAAQVPGADGHKGFALERSSSLTI